MRSPSKSCSGYKYDSLILDALLLPHVQCPECSCLPWPPTRFLLCFLLDGLGASLRNANFNRRSPSRRHQPLSHQLSLLRQPLRLALNSSLPEGRGLHSPLPELHRPERKGLLHLRRSFPLDRLLD